MEHTGTKSLGNRLRELRVSRGIRQEALARAAGVSPSYLSRIEAGQRDPSPPLLAALAHAVGCTTDFLVTGVDERRAQRVRLALRQAEYRLGAGEPERAEAEFAELVGAARDAGDVELLTQALAGRAAALEATGRLQQAIGILEPLREQVEAGGPRWMQAVIGLIRCYREVGDLGRAVDLGEAALRVLSDLGLRDSDDGIRVAVTLLSAYYERGDEARAVYLAEDSVARAERAGSPQSLAAAYWNASQLIADRGDVGGALNYAERAVALQGEGESERLLARARLAYANVLLRQDAPDVSAALSLQDRAAQALEAGAGSRFDLGYLAVERARAHLLRGDLEQAVCYADRALELFGEEPSLHGAAAYVVHGRVAALNGEPGGAIDRYRQAVAVLTGAGAGRRAAHLWTEIAALFDEAGDTAHARDAYRAATACLGMSPSRVFGPAAIEATAPGA
ncbi:MAG TPA: helix-turn-helix transcriptional regulator [Acidimicrobiales bacterium]|nr:helix-turn-helix transcriptional regulator [Acidimicrobiales bacterium]